MKTTFLKFIICFIGVVVCSATTVHAKENKDNFSSKHPGKTSSAKKPDNIPSTKFEQPLISIENLSAEFHPESKTLTVSATIRNVSHAFIKGYATVHLLSSEGAAIQSYEEEINRGDPFPHGITIDFEATTRVRDVDKISSITVEFTPH